MPDTPVPDTPTCAPASPAASPGGWQFWIDRGGTFTDLVARDPAGRLLTQRAVVAQAVDGHLPTVDDGGDHDVEEVAEQLDRDRAGVVGPAGRHLGQHVAGNRHAIILPRAGP